MNTSIMHWTQWRPSRCLCTNAAVLEMFALAAKCKLTNDVRVCKSMTRINSLFRVVIKSKLVLMSKALKLFRLIKKKFYSEDLK